MYDEIEKLYREKGVENIIFRKSFIFYFFLVVFLTISGIYHYFFYIIPVYVIVVIYIYSKVSIKVLKEKSIKGLSIKFRQHDIELMKKYIIDHHLDNNECLQNIIDHYRNLCSNQHTLLDFGFWITCTISIIPQFYGNNSIDITTVIKIFGIIILDVGIFYWIGKNCCNVIQSLYGSYNINESLERIFSDIFFEMNKTNAGSLENNDLAERKKLKKRLHKIKV